MPKWSKGRAPGVKNRLTLEREHRALSVLKQLEKGTGILPMDILMSRMRKEPLPDGSMPDDEQLQAAIAAAPYVHPRLATTETTIKSDNVHYVMSDKPMEADEWMAKYNISHANDAHGDDVVEDETPAKATGTNGAHGPTNGKGK